MGRYQKGNASSQNMVVVPRFCTTEEVQAMSSDNRPMAVLPRIAGETSNASGSGGAVTLDLLPRVRYRVRFENKEDDSDEVLSSSFDGGPYICFDSGVLIFPERNDAQSAVVVNLSDRISSLQSGKVGIQTQPQPRHSVASLQQQQKITQHDRFGNNNNTSTTTTTWRSSSCSSAATTHQPTVITPLLPLVPPASPSPIVGSGGGGCGTPPSSSPQIQLVSSS